MRIFGVSIVTILIIAVAYYAGSRGWLNGVLGAVGLGG